MNLSKQIKLIFIKATALLLLLPYVLKAQVTLDANGPGSTYELINSKFSPGYVAVEAPDQCASHPAFGRHIAEVFDATLNKFVFEFYIHVPTSFPVVANTADNDRCLNFDRQRIEIKTYDQSPANLKGTIGETVTYKWKFRLPLGFKPSPNFTHIHQVKAVGGDDGDPIFTLTVRSGSTNQLQCIYVKDSSSGQFYQSSIPLSSCLGIWIDATETVNVGTNGSYSIDLKRESDGVSLMSYAVSNIPTIRPSNTFLRPKWGIYRSLQQPSFLRDDSIRFASFSIAEGVLPVILKSFEAKLIDKKVDINLSVSNEINFSNYEIERSVNGRDFKTIASISASNKSMYQFQLDASADVKQFYRLKMIDKDGRFTYSNVVKIILENNTTMFVYPNPSTNSINVETNEFRKNAHYVITSLDGKKLLQHPANKLITTIDTTQLASGTYTINRIENNTIINSNKFQVFK